MTTFLTNSVIPGVELEESIEVVSFSKAIEPNFPVATKEHNYELQAELLKAM